MTRTKAEKIRKGIDNKIRKATVDMEWWADFWGFTVDEYEEFLDMAIKALEQEPNKDCISRGEVLRAIITCDTVGTDLTHLYEVIENMESIIPSKEGDNE